MINLKKPIAFTVAAILIVFAVLATMFFVNWGKGDGTLRIQYSNALHGTAAKSVYRTVPVYKNEETEILETRELDVQLETVENVGFKYTGYTFAGWRYGYYGELIEGSEEAPRGYVPGGLSDADGLIIFVAKWTNNTYVLSFNPDYPGILAPKNLEVTYDENIYGIEDPSVVQIGELKFQGWYTQKNGKGTRIIDGMNSTFAAHTMLYAYWASDTPEKLYSVSAKANPSYAGSVKASSTTGVAGDTVKITAEPANGYQIKSWSIANADFISGDNLSAERDIKINGSGTVSVTVNFEVKEQDDDSYTVIFDGNGASSGSMASQTYYVNQSQNLNSNQYERSYNVYLDANGGSVSTSSLEVNANFTGWNTNADGTGTRYIDNESVTNIASGSGSIRLYAQWSNASVTLPTPTHSTLNFSGWFTARSGGSLVASGDAPYTPTETITLYAQWGTVAQTYYTVSFYGNGQTGGSTSSQMHTVGQSQALTGNGYVRSHVVTFDAAGGSVSPASTTAAFSFMNWSTNQDGSGATYADGQVVSDLMTANGIFKLYAQWGNGAVSLPTPSRSGYTFLGWYNSLVGGTCLGQGGESYTPSSACTLYAQWDENEAEYLDVTVIAANVVSGGSVPFSTVYYNNVYKKGEYIGFYRYDYQDTTGYDTFSGYRFSHFRINGTDYYPGHNSGGYTFQNNIFAFYLNYDITVYAYYETDNPPIGTYQVSFNGNGSTGGSMPEQTHTIGQTQALTQNGYTKSNYVTYNANGGSVSTASANAVSTFSHWTTNAGGSGATYNNGQYVSNLASTGSTVYLYAQWNNSGIYLPAPSRTNYTFNGWYTSSAGGSYAGSGGSYYVPSGSVTLYAQWTKVVAQTYTVRFNSNGGGGSMSNQTHTVGQSQALSYNNFSRSNTVNYNANGGSVSPSYSTAASQFMYWSTNSSGSGATYSNGQYVSNLTSGGGSVNLYAQWGTASVNLPTPSRSNYTFNGWYTAPSGGSYVGHGGASYSVSGTATLYAQWTQVAAQTYTVVFNSNGGSGSMSNQIHTIGQYKSLTNNNYARSNRINYNANGGSVSPSYSTASASFVSWNTRADGSGTSYSNGQSVINITSASSTVYLYAQWRNTSVTLPTPTKSGYTFSGWYTSASSGSYVGSGGSSYTATSSNVTLYAHWQQVVSQNCTLTVKAALVPGYSGDVPFYPFTTPARVGEQMQFKLYGSNGEFWYDMYEYHVFAYFYVAGKYYYDDFIYTMTGNGSTDTVTVYYYPY